MAGDDAGAVAERAESSRVEALLGKAVGDIGIPPCPAVLTQITAEMARDEPDFTRLESIISSDVALAGGLVALANSPFFGVRLRVRSVRQALQMLGLGMASRAIAGLILRKMFPPSAAMERFWDSSARIARLSGWLAGGPHVAVKVRADEAYTFGLFRDCGIPVLLRRFPQYPAALSQANTDEQGDFTAIEESHCKTNHAAIGCLLAQAWWLPDEVSLAIRHHHDCRRLAPGRNADLPSGAIALIAIAHLAEHLLQEHTGLSRTAEWRKVAGTCLSVLGITDQGLAEIRAASVAIATAEQ